MLEFRPMKLLLTGATGLLGRAIVKSISGRTHIQLVACGHSRARPPMLSADITDQASVESLFDAAQPEIVVHAAAERRPDVVDKTPEAARTLNVAATRLIAEACARRGAFMLYISTDYVFDGSNPPYYPDSPVNPLNEYGKLKLEGERRVAEILGEPPRAAILRIPLLYGPVESLAECSVTELATVLLRGKPRKVEDWARRYPLHVEDVAEAILKIVEAWARSPEKFDAARSSRGLPIYQLSGPKSYTKFEMVSIMARAFGIDASFVEPDPEPPRGAPRPKDCRLDTSLIEALGYAPHVAFERGIHDVLAPFFGR
jgi:dTDP-4-dehydrorhamnose reductase